MNVLVIASFNQGCFAPFILEQAKALGHHGCMVDFFGLQGKGVIGYLKNLPGLKRKIKAFCPDVIHAHYGLSGLLANLQGQVPVVTTYHGSDINDKRVLPFSKMAIRLSAWNVFVSRKTMEIVRPKRSFTLLPCGVDFSEMQLMEKTVARQNMRLAADKRYILFAGAFDNAVKNAPLAKQAVEALQDDNAELLELKSYSREEVTQLMCAADAFLMTSFSEGSPQVIKEALACGCPIVSVDVGDVKERVEGLEGCYVAETRDPQALAQLLQKAMTLKGKTRGRERLVSDGLDNKFVAQELIRIYERVVKK